MMARWRRSWRSVRGCRWRLRGYGKKTNKSEWVTHSVEVLKVNEFLTCLNTVFKNSFISFWLTGEVKGHFRYIPHEYSISRIQLSSFHYLLMNTLIQNMSKITLAVLNDPRLFIQRPIDMSFIECEARILLSNHFTRRKNKIVSFFSWMCVKEVRPNVIAVPSILCFIWRGTQSKSWGLH